jgi:hypothetical protein
MSSSKFVDITSNTRHHQQHHAVLLQDRPQFEGVIIDILF